MHGCGSDGSCSCLTISLWICSPFPSLCVMRVTLIKSLSLTHANWNVRFTQDTVTPTQHHIYSHAHLVTLLSLVRSVVFAIVVAHVRDTCSCFLPPSSSLHRPATPIRPCLHGLQLSPALTPNNQRKSWIFQVLFWGYGNTVYFICLALYIYKFQGYFKKEINPM